MDAFPRIDGLAVAVDTETTGLDPYRAKHRPFGVAIATEDAEWYFDSRQHPRLWEWLAAVLPGCSMVAGHNLKFDLNMLRCVGVGLPAAIHCTMVAEALIDEHRLQYDLDSVCRDRGIGRKVELPSKVNMADLPEDVVSKYARQDVRLTYDLFAAQVGDIRAQELDRVMAMEMRLLPVLADMEHVGVRVDIGAAHAAIPRLNLMAHDLQSDVNMLAGRPLNVNSTPQIRALFSPKQLNKFQWELRDGTLVGPTKGGDSPSIDQHALRRMRDPVAQKIMMLRKTIKTRDTFVRGHVLGHADERGYVHTTFNQTRTESEAGTGTGRLSSTDPALQQINARDEESASVVRALFLPDEGHEWLRADYSQIDFRTCAHLIRDPRLLAAYAGNPDLDFHQVVSDMTGIPRNPAYAGAPNTKTLNLSLSFGAGAGKIAFTMGMPYTVGEVHGRLHYFAGPEAQAVLDGYHERFPYMRKFAKEAEAIANSRGYVKTVMGRRLRFPRGGQHKAAGLLYQAYAAEVHKVGLLAVDERLRQTPGVARLLLSVHDEIGVSVPPGATDLDAGIGSCYTRASSLSEDPDAPFKLRVPVRTALGRGANWFLAK